MLTATTAIYAETPPPSAGTKGCDDAPFVPPILEQPPPPLLPIASLPEALLRQATPSNDVRIPLATPLRGATGPAAALPAAGEASAPRDEADKAFEVGMKVLVLSSTGNAVSEVFLPLAKQALASHDIPYDHIVLTESGLRVSEAPLPLEDANGVGRYYAVVLTSEQLGFQTPSGTWGSALTPMQWAQLDAYERRYHVRRVALAGYPRTGLGVVAAGDAQTAANGLRMSPYARPYLAGLVPDVLVPVVGAWQNPGRLVDDRLAHKFAQFSQPSSDGLADPLAAVVTSFADGREQLTFFLSQSPFLYASYYLAPAWIQWLTRGVYVGKRRMFLNVQVDDLFLSNSIWDLHTLFADEPDRTYRLTPEDFEEFARWQARFQGRLPPGSRFRVEFCFNGYGVYESRQQYHDGLYLTAKKHLDDFNWVSHTFTHPDLDTLSYARTVDDVRANQLFAADFLSGHEARFSPQALVLPLISGLFNGEALRALFETGIKSVISDMSRRDHWPTDLYHGFWTNTPTNGFEGVFVIPRQPIVIPVSAGSGPLLEAFYNSLYRRILGRDLKLPEIFDLEAKRVAKLVLAFRHDPYMSHQANIWGFDRPGDADTAPRRTSLLALWINTVAKEVYTYVTLPLLSAKMDDLARLFQERMAFDACEFDGRLVVRGGALVGIRGRTSYACQVPITGIVTSDGPTVTHEIYGPDRTTYVKSLAGGSFALTLTPAIPLQSGTESP